MPDFISGIQQIGIGVRNATESLHRYAKLFGMDVLVFDDTSEASLMTRYTGGKTYKRQALLSINMQGGGGFELWQFQDRQPADPAVAPQYGDLGIYAARIKCADVKRAHRYFLNEKKINTSALQEGLKNSLHFWVKDDQHNIFNIVSGNHWFQQDGKKCVGGVIGAVIGVSDLKRSVAFYQTLLNLDNVVYSEDTCQQNVFQDDKYRYRKALLQKTASSKGAFANLLGPVEIELVQCLDRQPSKIFEHRYWGDCGFIHLCFDAFDMCGLKKHAEQNGYMFTVDSVDTFEMENASGRFCYMEDPDGTLIELVETHKVPIVKKLGLYLDLKKRNLEKPLPGWMIRLLKFNKVK